jgi:hypothetical protein
MGQWPGSEAIKGGRIVKTDAGARLAAPRPYVRIVVAESDRPKLWQIISDNEWSGEYLGKNVFVFRQEQLNVINKAGIPFQSID